MQEHASEMEPMTISGLLEMQALSVRPTAPEDLWVSESSSTFTWDMWAGDEVRAHYDDDAELGLDAALAAQPGIDEVVWMDREVLLLSAPSLCADGVLATAAVVLLDDRIRATVD